MLFDSNFLEIQNLSLMSENKTLVTFKIGMQHKRYGTSVSWMIQMFTLVGMVVTEIYICKTSLIHTLEIFVFHCILILPQIIKMLEQGHC